MNMRYALFVVLLLLGTGSGQAKVDYDHDSIYKVLRDSMSESFNNADEVRFNRDIKKLEDICSRRTTCMDTIRSAATKSYS